MRPAATYSVFVFVEQTVHCPFLPSLVSQACSAEKQLKAGVREVKGLQSAEDMLLQCDQYLENLEM